MDNNAISAQRLAFEAKAFDLGFCDKVMTTLVADLLMGACHMALDTSRLLSMVPGGLHIRKELREAICIAGQELEDTQDISYDEIKGILSRFSADITAAAKENGIMSSTGDCRGACKYNVGDSSEYLKYGW